MRLVCVTTSEVLAAITNDGYVKQSWVQTSEQALLQNIFGIQTVLMELGKRRLYDLTM
jgi:curli biogenesis system outer membrane secretion channel CsgG